MAPATEGETPQSSNVVPVDAKMVRHGKAALKTDRRITERRKLEATIVDDILFWDLLN
jgi:hypothetical protein